MGNQLSAKNSFLRITVYGVYNHCTGIQNRLVLKHCQLHNTLKKTITVSTLRLHNFCCKTQGMDTENVNCQDKQQTEICQTTKLLEESQQSQDVVEKILSKRTLKRMARAQKHKEYKKRKREENLQLIHKDEVGCSAEDLRQTSYYFENGVRKVYPYSYIFATHAKGRWVGRKLQDVLETEFGYDQPDDLVRAFEMGMIHVNGKQASLNYTLRDNDYICHKTHRHENPVTAAPIEILENSEDLIVINKPCSIPCHPCGRYRFNSVVFILGKEMGLVNLRHIYRLDRLTSGILILGKSPERTKMLMDQVARRQVQKEYVCRVVGEFPDGTVKVDQPLAALSNKLRLQVISRTGKSSQTTFTRISYNGRSSVVKCIPHTGRTHQIRVHLQYLGHPIINDSFYNSDAWGPSRGKNGDYELPFDKVCEKILAVHHNNKWSAGENPLYEDKLRELKANKQLSVGVSDHSKVPSASSSDSPRTEEPRCPELCESASKNLQDATALPHIVSDLLTNGVDNSVVDSHLPSTHSEVGPHPQNSSRLLEQVPETSSEPTESCCSKAQDQPQYPGFDLSKWSVDPLCDLCKKLAIDPEEKHMVMFLHALKYKGPGWQYETALPDWASQDWSREDDFIL